MLGDATHHDFYVYGTLLKVLDALADDVVAVDGKTDLTLILEMSPEDAKILSNYVTTGDPGETIEKKIPNMHYEDFEYYSNLRKYYKRISDERFAGKLNLKIAGFESMNLTPTIDMIKLTPWQSDSTFLVRDSLLSLRISDYVTNNPNSKILIFYGDGHLQKGLSLKRTNYGTHGECFGYFIADYLKRFYGDEIVLTFEQKWLVPEFFNGTVYSEAKDVNIVGDCTTMDTSQFPWARPYDYLVFWKDTPKWDLPHRFELVFSRRNVEKYLEELKFCNEYRENQQVKEYSSVPLFYLNFITCNNFETPDQAIKWDEVGSYIGFDVMLSDCFKKRIYDAFAHSKSKTLLKILGLKSKNLEAGNVSDTLKKFEEIWDENLKSIMFMNGIGIMWMGYPDEQKKAKEYLVQYSGKDFENPADYLDWYRNSEK